MTSVSAIFDTNALIYFTSVNAQYPILNTLKNIFSAVHIPDVVYLEYYKGAVKDQERFKIIGLIDGNDKFWRKCTSYDTIGKFFYETHKEIDTGEAAALAQQTKIFARYIVSDDAKFAVKAKDLSLTATVITTMHLFAIMDVNGYIINWGDCMRSLHLSRKFTSSQLRSAYNDVTKWYGVEISKQTLTEKSSFRRLGIDISMAKIKE